MQMIAWRFLSQNLLCANFILLKLGILSGTFWAGEKRL